MIILRVKELLPICFHTIAKADENKLKFIHFVSKQRRLRLSEDI